MADHDDAASDDFPMIQDRSSLISPDTAKLLAAAAFGVAAGAFVTRFLDLEFGRSGDEAPIRVKGGSTIVELLDERAHWVEEQGGNKKKWFISRGAKSKEEYDVVVVVKTPGGKLTSQVLAGKQVEIYRNDEAWIEFKATGYKTKVTSHRDPLNLSGYDQVLSHTYNIVKVKVGKFVPYQPGDGTLEEVLLLDNCGARRRR